MKSQIQINRRKLLIDSFFTKSLKFLQVETNSVRRTLADILAAVRKNLLVAVTCFWSIACCLATKKYQETYWTCKRAKLLHTTTCPVWLQFVFKFNKILFIEFARWLQFCELSKWQSFSLTYSTIFTKNTSHNKHKIEKINNEREIKYLILSHYLAAAQKVNDHKFTGLWRDSQKIRQFQEVNFFLLSRSQAMDCTFGVLDSENRGCLQTQLTKARCLNYKRPLLLSGLNETMTGLWYCSASSPLCYKIVAHRGTRTQTFWASDVRNKDTHSSPWIHPCVWSRPLWILSCVHQLQPVFRLCWPLRTCHLYPVSLPPRSCWIPCCPCCSSWKRMNLRRIAIYDDKAQKRASNCSGLP